MPCPFPDTLRERDFLTHENRPPRQTRFCRLRSVIFWTGEQPPIAVYSASACTLPCKFRGSLHFKGERMSSIKKEKAHQWVNHSRSQRKGRSWRLALCSDLRLCWMNTIPVYQWFLFPVVMDQDINRFSETQDLTKPVYDAQDSRGASTRLGTALTQMSDAESRWELFQEVSGHRTLDELQKYLEVRGASQNDRVTIYAVPYRNQSYPGKRRTEIPINETSRRGSQD